MRPPHIQQGSSRFWAARLSLSLRRIHEAVFLPGVFPMMGGVLLMGGMLSPHGGVSPMMGGVCLMGAGSGRERQGGVTQRKKQTGREPPP